MKKINKKNGSALIISLVSLAVLGLIVLNIGGVVRSEYLSSSTRYSGDGFQAAYNSFSGVQYAIDQILADLGNNDVDGTAAASSSITIREDGSSEDEASREIDFEVFWSPGITVTQDDVESNSIEITSTGSSGGINITTTAGIRISKETRHSTSYDKYTFKVKVVSWGEEIL